jgi:alpha-D-xyloside xylohydrolase
MISTKKLLASLMLGAVPIALLPGCDSSSQNIQQAEQHKPLGTVEKTDSGVVVTLPSGPAKKVRLQVMSDEIIRVTAVPHGDLDAHKSLMVVAKPADQAAFDVERKGNAVQVKTEKTTAEVSLLDGTVKFLNAQGEVVLEEASRGSFAPVTADPEGPTEGTYAIRQAFNQSTGEGFYGLGQQQDGQINLAGENVLMTTYNMVITVPFLVSSRDYGLLWDNSSITRFGDPRPAQPLGESLTLYDANGNKGGLTARYYDGDELKLTRVESDLNYQFLSHGSVRENPFPEEVADAKDLRIEWVGSIQPNETGEHKFKMYSSGYAKLAIDDEVMLDRWRMNWNPWYHNLSVGLKAGQKKDIRISWKPDGGYFRLLHNDPLPTEERNQLSFASETGKAIDYYFVLGEDKDDVIAGYRELTGKSVMLPRWAYGFWQSRERYESQQELINVVEEYRERDIPLDNIVLDWSYWPQDAWGSHDFDKQHFPDPSAMVDRVHELNARIMISVWPKFYPTTENYKELNEKGYMHNQNIEEGNLDWIGPGYPNAFYDPYPLEAREIFWRQIKDKIKVHGFDAWWLDATEPDIHSNVSFEKRKELMGPNALGTGAEYFNSYALPQAEGVYAGEREYAPEERSFILTRSGFGGVQRAGAALWSGDVVSRWSNLREQIAAGVGISMAGVPNWTFDIGGFTPEDRFMYSPKTGRETHSYADMDPAQVPEWQELNARWFQFGAFVPLFRSHGQNPSREIYNVAAEGTEVYDTLVWYTKLRYRLMPYIYSQAGDMYHKDGTLMRGLVMDFPKDEVAANVDDQYMFGPAFLVNPVHELNARSREVYLPTNKNRTVWYNFYTGERFNGGKTIEADAPLARMPLFVKGGSIIPVGPEIQYTGQKPHAPITLMVYTGQDGHFELYNDDGVSYDYEKGEFTRIPISYDDEEGTLTIGAREGEFEEMAKTRTFNVRWISGPTKDATNFTAKPDASVQYSGEPVVVKR